MHLIQTLNCCCIQYLVLQKGLASVEGDNASVEFEFNESATPTQFKPLTVINAVSDGVIAPDVGQLLIGSIASMLED